MTRMGPKPRISEAQREQIRAAYIQDPETARQLAVFFGVRRAYADELASQYMIIKPKIGRKGGRLPKPRAFEGGAKDKRWRWAIERGAVEV